MMHFLWLGHMGLSVSVYAWPISLALGLWLCWALFQAWRRRAQLTSAVCWLLPLGFLTPVLLLLYGTLHAAGPGWSPQPGAGIAPVVVYGILFTHLAFVTVTAYRSKVGRELVLAVGMLQLWIAIGMGFVALMSVSGVWL